MSKVTCPNCGAELPWNQWSCDCGHDDDANECKCEFCSLPDTETVETIWGDIPIGGEG